jgi:hypothetical protein
MGTAREEKEVNESNDIGKHELLNEGGEKWKRGVGVPL